MSSRPMSLTSIVLIVVIASAVVGAALGILRTQVGGPAWLTGAVAGAAAGGLAATLMRRRGRGRGNGTE